MPKVKLDNGDDVTAGELRRFIYKTYRGLLEQVEKRKRGKLYSVLNGDMGEGDFKERTTSLITKDKTRIVGYMNDVYDPIFQMSTGVWNNRGTEAHIGCNGELEELMAQNFKNTIKDPDGNASWKSLFLNFEGVTIDIMHHPASNGGGRPMNRGNVVDRLASDTMFTYANSGEVPPQLVIRSHLHGYMDSYDRFRTRGIITPPLSLLTPYQFRSGINRENSLGCILIHCHNGEFEVEPIIEKARKPQWQVVK